MIRIQDSNFDDSYSFHEILVDTFKTSIDGFGMYAFASSAGAKLLFNDIEVINYFSAHKYQLLVGTDSITNERSIESLYELSERLQGLEVKAYLNEESNLFHPKLSLFENENNTGNLLIGSNNLTTGGLRKNIEALSNIEINYEEYLRNKAYLDKWLKQSNSRILELTDNRIIERVKLNNTSFLKKTRIEIKKPEDSKQNSEIIDSSITNEIIDGWTFGSNSPVLFAEIPKSGNRWKQANFDKSTFKEFFGATPGNNIQRILLRVLDSDGKMGEVEVRPSVSVISQNYRFELNAASGLAYPTNNKAPIGIFVRLTVRMFIYRLYMPSDEKYDEILDWMRNNWEGRTDRKIRIVKPYQFVNNLLGNTSFNRYLHKSRK